MGQIYYRKPIELPHGRPMDLCHLPDLYAVYLLSGLNEEMLNEEISVFVEGGDRTRKPHALQLKRISIAKDLGYPEVI